MIEVLLSIVAAVIAAVICGEAKAWSPAVVRRLTKWATALAPERQRSRLSEEWAAHTNEIPGVIGRLLAAVGFVIAARRISREHTMGVRKLKAIIAAMPFQFALQGMGFELRRGSLRTKLPRALRSFRQFLSIGRSLASLVRPALQGERPSTYVVNVIEGFARVLTDGVRAKGMALDKSWNVDPATGNLVEVEAGYGQIRISKASDKAETRVRFQARITPLPPEQQ